MVICVQRHTNVSKQTTLLEGIDLGMPNWCVCWLGLNVSVNEGMNDISNVKVKSKQGCHGQGKSYG